MFSSTCLLVSKILRRNYSTDFQKLRWKGGTLATEETVRFWW